MYYRVFVIIDKETRRKFKKVLCSGSETKPYAFTKFSKAYETYIKLKKETSPQSNKDTAVVGIEEKV